MKRYKNINGKSNVEMYSIGLDYIDVKFKGTLTIYEYSYATCGKENVENMKLLAKKGGGLNSYIMKTSKINI